MQGAAAYLVAGCMIGHEAGALSCPDVYSLTKKVENFCNMAGILHVQGKRKTEKKEEENGPMNTYKSV